MGGIIRKEDIGNSLNRIQNILEEPKLLTEFKKYITETQPSFLKTLELWQTINTSKQWDERIVMNYIEEIDGFNVKHLETKITDQEKIAYTKEACCSILEDTRVDFIRYLKSF